MKLPVFVPQLVARAALGATLAASGGALAQSSLADGVSVERMQLDSDPSGVLGVEGGEVLPHLEATVATWSSWSQNPLILYRAEDQTRVAALVGQRVGVTLSGAIGLWDRAQLGVALPGVAYQNRRPGELAESDLGPISSGGLGNLWLTPKLRLLRAETSGLELAALSGFAIPLGSGDGYLAERSFAVRPELAASRAFGAVRFAANVGAMIRPTRELLDLRLGSELFADVGAAYRVSTAPLELSLTLSGATSATRPFAQRNETSLEARAAAAYAITPWAQAFVGGGRGLSPGWGTPDWRLFGGLRFDLQRPRAPSAPLAPLAGLGPTLLTSRPQAARIALPAPTPALRSPELARAGIEGELISFDGRVHFASDRDLIDDASREVLEQVVAVLAAHPEIARVRVEGHTDSEGDARRNIDLSARRARAVVAYLVTRGVASERLVSEGFGPRRPLVPNDSPEGRQRNRRVEFHIVSSSQSSL